MKLISLHEDPGKIQTIDRLVKEGVFSSRAELYRTGAYLMISLPEARRLSLLDRLDFTLLGKEVRNCLSALERNDLDTTEDRLGWLIDALRFRAIYATILGEQTRQAYETAADGFARYMDVVRKLDEYDSETKSQVLSDLRRDLSALADSVRNQLETIHPTASEPPSRIYYSSLKPYESDIRLSFASQGKNETLWLPSSSSGEILSFPQFSSTNKVVEAKVSP